MMQFAWDPRVILHSISFILKSIQVWTIKYAFTLFLATSVRIDICVCDHHNTEQSMCKNLTTTLFLQYEDFFSSTPGLIDTSNYVLSLGDKLLSINSSSSHICLVQCFSKCGSGTPVGSLIPFQRVCKVKTTCIMKQRDYLLFPLSLSHKYAVGFSRGSMTGDTTDGM